jgi:ankyrin repeat protein
LHDAVRGDNLDIVSYFVERRFDIHAENDGGNTPLSLSLHNNKIVRYLLDCDPRIPSTQILVLPILWTALDLIKMLLNHGVDPNGYDNSGRTPLHYACCQFKPAIVSLLLDYGADPELKDQKGNTCVDLMVGTHKTTQVIMDIIRNHQAIPDIKEPE